jgi:hypothetical protein
MKRQLPLWAVLAALVLLAVPEAVSAQCGKCSDVEITGPHWFGGGGAFFECDVEGCHGATKPDKCSGKHGTTCGTTEEDLEQLAMVVDRGEPSRVLTTLASLEGVDFNVASGLIEARCQVTGAVTARLEVPSALARFLTAETDGAVDIQPAN